MVSANAVGPGKIKKMKKKSTKKFIDTLPPVKRRGRPPKKLLKTAEVIGTLEGANITEEPEIEPDIELKYCNGGGK